MVEVEVKQWGNSLGIVLPKQLVNDKKIKKGQKIDVEIFKKLDFSEIFGACKTGMTGQEFKDMAREGWD